MIQTNHKFILLIRQRLLSIGFMLILFSFYSFGQESIIRNDFEVWLFTKVSKKINNKWSAEVQLADRFDKNARFQKAIFIEPSIAYQIHKGIETSLSYRYSVDPLDFGTRSRITTRTNFTKRFKPYDVSFRFRTDSELASDDVIDDIRTRIGIRYKRKKYKWSPAVTFELFTGNQNEGWRPSKWRSKAGIKYQLNKRHDLNLFYAVQREFNTNAPNQDFILGLGYGYSIRKRKKAQKPI